MAQTGVQTQQFLMFLAHQDKLTKLYKRIKAYQCQKLQHDQQIKKLESKVQVLERSLLQLSSKDNEMHSSRNQMLLKQVTHLEEELMKQNKDLKYAKIKGANKENKGNYQRRKNKEQSKCKTEEFNNVSLSTIKQQSELSFQQPRECSYKKDKQKQFLLNMSQTIKKTDKNGKKIDQIQLLSDKLNQVYKQLQRQEKAKKLVDVQNRRLRKLNEQYSTKCRRLQKLVQAKSQLYNNLHNAFSSNALPFQTHCSYLLTESDNQKLFQ